MVIAVVDFVTRMINFNTSEKRTKTIVWKVDALSLFLVKYLLYSCLWCILCRTKFHTHHRTIYCLKLVYIYLSLLQVNNKKKHLHTIYSVQRYCYLYRRNLTCEHESAKFDNKIKLMKIQKVIFDRINVDSNCQHPHHYFHYCLIVF